jgi:hypothetical protein
MATDMVRAGNSDHRTLWPSVTKVEAAKRILGEAVQVEQQDDNHHMLPLVGLAGAVLAVYLPALHRHSKARW